MSDPNCIAVSLPARCSSRLSFYKKVKDSWTGLRFALRSLFVEVRDGNGLDPKSRNCLWVNGLNASVAFPLNVPLSVIDSTRAARIAPCAEEPL